MKKERFNEILRFAVTGGVCFVIEFAVLVLLKSGLGLDTLMATPIAFAVSVIFNYVLCMVWVFGGAKNSGGAAKAGFAVTSVTGLLLNELLMFVFGRLLGDEAVLFSVLGFAVSVYMVNKVMATLIVMIWNYFTKRWILKKPGRK